MNENNSDRKSYTVSVDLLVSADSPEQAIRKVCDVIASTPEQLGIELVAVWWKDKP